MGRRCHKAFSISLAPPLRRWWTKKFLLNFHSESTALRVSFVLWRCKFENHVLPICDLLDCTMVESLVFPPLLSLFPLLTRRPLKSESFSHFRPSSSCVFFCVIYIVGEVDEGSFYRGRQSNDVIKLSYEALVVFGLCRNFTHKIECRHLIFNFNFIPKVIYFKAGRKNNFATERPQFCLRLSGSTFHLH